MPRVPFSFVLTGGGDKYGTPFVATDDAFGTHSELNGVLAAIAAATQTPTVFGITLPPTSKAYKITKVLLTSDDADDDVNVGIWDGAAAIAPLATIINGTGEHDFGPGITVAAGYIPFIEYKAGSGDATIAGYIDWEAA